MKHLLLAINIELAADGPAPEWIQLLPAGKIVKGRDGRTWMNDHPDGILEAFAADESLLSVYAGRGLVVYDSGNEPAGIIQYQEAVCGIAGS